MKTKVRREKQTKEKKTRRFSIPAGFTSKPWTETNKSNRKERNSSKPIGLHTRCCCCSFLQPMFANLLWKRKKTKKLKKIQKLLKLSNTQNSSPLYIYVWIYISHKREMLSTTNAKRLWKKNGDDDEDDEDGNDDSTQPQTPSAVHSLYFFLRNSKTIQRFCIYY